MLSHIRERVYMLHPHQWETLDSWAIDERITTRGFFHQTKVQLIGKLRVITDKILYEFV
jgi:hypothetical protein